MIINYCSKSYSQCDGTQRVSSLRRLLCLVALLVYFVGQGWAEEYDLYICGVQVTDENKNNLSSIEGVKGGDIYFDGTTLSLYYASIDATGITIDGESVDGITIGQVLTLNLVGQNSIKSDKAGLKVTAVTTISGSESFNVEGKEQGIYAKRAGAVNAGDILKPFLTISGGIKVSAKSEGYGIESGTLFQRWRCFGYAVSICSCSQFHH